MPSYQLVEQSLSIVEDLSRCPRLGIDTEFMREKTYFAELCLLQVAADGTIYCIDPLPDGIAAAAWDALLSREWVVHSARQDIEVVFQASERMPEALFDTQVAAALCGLPPQAGYAALVRELIGVDMDKSHTRADWARRPLRPEYLDYAAEDVEYLLAAADLLSERLTALGRLDWAREDSAQLLEPSLYTVDAETAIDRLKGARNFRGRRRAAAVRLAAWREQVAIERNRPRQWIVRDKPLLDIAWQLPASRKALADIDGLPEKVADRHADDLLAAVAESAGDDDRHRPSGAPDEEQKALLKKMQTVVAAQADELGIAAETIASRRELSAIIIGGNQESRVFGGWRAGVIGNELRSML